MLANRPENLYHGTRQVQTKKSYHIICWHGRLLLCRSKNTRVDHFVGFSVGSGLAVGPFILDLAYTFRTGTVQSQATDTTAHQHTVLTSLIYHF